MSIGIPVWMLLVAVVAGLALASVLYVKNKRQHYGRALTIVLFVLRSLIGFGVVMLLFNPYIRQNVSAPEQPTVILVHDNSASIVLSKDSSFFKEDYPAQFNAFREALNSDFQVDEYLFGQEVRDFDELDFDDQLTDLSAVLQHIDRRYYKRNVGAVLLFSDGIYNRGYEPSLLAERFVFPVHTVVLGDTMSYPDLRVKDVHYNKRVSQGSTFPVRVEVGGVDCQGCKAKLTLSEDGNVIAQQDVEVSSNRFSKEIDFMLEADARGDASRAVRQIEIEISGLEDESQLLNNVKRIFIEVHDQKYKVLCLAYAPHPDLGAIKSVMNDDCEVDFVFGRDAIPELSQYQLLVLHQTPSAHTDMEALYQQLEKNKKLPVLVVVGKATDVEALNKLQQAVELRRGTTNSTLDVKGNFNTSFGTFTVSEKLREDVGRFPPLAMPHLDINLLSAHDDLLLQEVLGAKSGLPLMTFAKTNRKMVFVFGTNVWRWRLVNYYRDHNNAVFDELFSKTLKYLLLSSDDGSAVFAKEEYYSNEPVVMTAELRNPSNELIVKYDLSIQIVNKKTGETYDYMFSKREHDYELNAGILPEGVYTYRAAVEMVGKKISMNGSFSVVSLGIEAQQLTADIQRMRSLSSATNGRCYTVDQLPQLLDDLKDDPRITSVEHYETRFEDLIHSRWILFVLIGLVAIEWILRKMFGTY